MVGNRQCTVVHTRARATAIANGSRRSSQRLEAGPRRARNRMLWPRPSTLGPLRPAGDQDDLWLPWAAGLTPTVRNPRLHPRGQSCGSFRSTAPSAYGCTRAAPTCCAFAAESYLILISRLAPWDGPVVTSCGLMWVVCPHTTGNDITLSACSPKRSTDGGGDGKWTTFSRQTAPSGLPAEAHPDPSVEQPVDE